MPCFCEPQNRILLAWLEGLNPPISVIRIVVCQMRTNDNLGGAIRIVVDITKVEGRRNQFEIRFYRTFNKMPAILVPAGVWVNLRRIGAVLLHAPEFVEIGSMTK